MLISLFFLYSFQYECNPEEGLMIVIESKRYKCHKEGQRIFILHDSARLRHQGLIICPACEEICQVFASLGISPFYHLFSANFKRKKTFS